MRAAGNFVLRPEVAMLHLDGDLSCIEELKNIAMHIPWGRTRTVTQGYTTVSFFLKFYFIFKLYNIVLILPNIKMNPPQAYTTVSWLLFPCVFTSSPSLIGNCLNLPFGTQGKSRRLNETISYKPETGDTERLLCPGGPHRVLLGFNTINNFTLNLTKISLSTIS